MLWRCKGCGTLYAPDQPKCPACGSKSYAEAPGDAQSAIALPDPPPTVSAIPAAALKAAATPKAAT